VDFPRSLLDALAPPLCVLCRAPAGGLTFLCEPCASRLVLCRPPLCLRCGAPCALPTPVCDRCPDWPRVLVGARSAAPHAGVASDLVARLRHAGRLEAAYALGCLAAAAARSRPLPDDVLVTHVPLHRAARRRRGFDPSAEVARVVARALGARARTLLTRVRPEGAGGPRTAAGQAREERGAYRAHPRARGRDVLLVDVALATGARLGACARALNRRGVREVFAVTATRAP
jgi:predicted amidophosphoribosyltransferase